MEKSDISEQSKKPLKKRKQMNSCDDLLSEAVKILKEPTPDGLDVFGKYVAAELRSLQSEQIRSQIKREISRAILQGQEKDEKMKSTPFYDSWASRTPSPACFDGPACSVPFNSDVSSATPFHYYCTEDATASQSYTTLMPSFKHP